MLVLALMPIDVPIPSTGWDKSNHLLAFSVMALFGCRAYPGRTMAVLAGLLACGALIEALQSFTPNRSAQWQDLVADAVGLALGWSAEQLPRVMRRLRAGLHKPDFLHRDSQAAAWLSLLTDLTRQPVLLAYAHEKF